MEQSIKMFVVLEISFEALSPAMVKLPVPYIIKQILSREKIFLNIRYLPQKSMFDMIDVFIHFTSLILYNINCFYQTQIIFYT